MANSFVSAEKLEGPSNAMQSNSMAGIDLSVDLEPHQSPFQLSDLVALTEDGRSRSEDRARDIVVAQRLLPQGVITLGRDQLVEISAPGMIFDCDETKLEHTGEQVHDGPEGRFALALQEVLLEDHGITFTSDWETYKAFAGLAEEEVCKGIAEQASREYGVQVDVGRYTQRSRDIVLERFEEFVDRINPVPGIRELLLSCKAAESKMVICTSSSEAFISRALDHFRLLQFFDEAVYAAGKKVDAGFFSGNPIAEAAQKVQLRPQDAVMVGDSISDYASAALAGAGAIIIRFPGGASNQQQQLAKFEDRLDEVFVNHSQELGGHRPTVYVVQDYSQVRMKPSQGAVYSRVRNVTMPFIEQ